MAALLELCDGFVEAETLRPTVGMVDGGTLPDPCRTLLVHNDHMTTTLESHYGRPVELSVLEERIDGDLYRRMIVLSLRDSKQVVEFGVVRIDSSLIAPAARAEILNQSAPLGDILIRHNVLRRVEPRWYFQCLPNCPFIRHFGKDGSAKPGQVFGRVGVITCNQQPGIELIEVVASSRPT
jgi:hypothetical protein